MCIFDSEFLSACVSLLLCPVVSNSPSLLVSLPVWISLFPPCPCLSVCCSPFPGSWELAGAVFILFQLLILKLRPSAPARPASGVSGRLGWGARGGLSRLLRTSCTSLVLQLRRPVWGAEKAAVGGVGGRKGVDGCHTDPPRLTGPARGHTCCAGCRQLDLGQISSCDSCWKRIDPVWTVAGTGRLCPGLSLLPLAAGTHL